MKKTGFLLIVILLLAYFSDPARAHFGMIIPSDTMIMQDDSRFVNIQFSFSHPFEGKGLTLDKPKICGVMANGKFDDLLDIIRPAQVMQHSSWETDIRIKRPGVYMFFMEPRPYWEPTEDIFIIHYTKTVVTAFGIDEGWDEAIGLDTEIIPLSKPYGLYVGNIFQGIVIKNGKPIPYSKVEVAYYNKEQKLLAPTDYMITQTIKADANGIFSYSAPTAGWWGFAALNPADYRLKHDGIEKDVELGAVIWVKFHDLIFK
jgi:cobalt/nickel transport protein